jgi:hypothetical protein
MFSRGKSRIWISKYENFKKLGYILNRCGFGFKTKIPIYKKSNNV